jgi:hypothetical protein
VEGYYADHVTSSDEEEELQYVDTLALSTRSNWRAHAKSEFNHSLLPPAAPQAVFPLELDPLGALLGHRARSSKSPCLFLVLYQGLEDVENEVEANLLEKQADLMPVIGGPGSMS